MTHYKKTYESKYKSPLFIVGHQRSGTTMLRLMLDSHPNIAIPFETDFILPYYFKCNSFGTLKNNENIRKLLSEIMNNPFIKKGELSSIKVDDLVSKLEEKSYAGVVDCIFRTWATSRNKIRWGDKNPNAPQVHLLNDIFPEAMFLHIIRDGRDVAVSKMNLRASWKAQSVISCAHSWCWNISFVRSISPILGKRYKEIKYENLVTSPEDTLKEVCDWLDEPYSDAMLDYHLTGARRMPSEIIETEHRNSVLPIDRSKIGMWRKKMSKGDRAVFQTITKPLLKSLGYELEDEKAFDFRLKRKISEITQAYKGHVSDVAPVFDYWFGRNFN